MTKLFLALPSYYEQVFDRLCRADWLVHNFPAQGPDDLYNPANYLHNIEFEGAEYRALLDLNVFQYVVNCVKKTDAREEYRNACALLLFCRIAEIQLEPALAIYERINYGAGNLDEALDDLALLRALDNADPEQLARYMLGDSDSLRDIKPIPLDREAIGADLTRYRRLTHWDSIYVLVLGAVATHWDSDIPASNRLEQYLEWVIREFRVSLPCLVYATRLFGNDPLSKMMKYKPDAPEDLKRAALFNMTWDLFYIDHFFKNWSDPKKTWEEMFFTQDRLLRSLLRLAISIQNQGDVAPLFKNHRASDAVKYHTLLENRDSRVDRVYGTPAWSATYREELIRKLESRLGVSHNNYLQWTHNDADS